MYWADEMVPKRENGQAVNSRLTRYIMLASILRLSSLYHATHTVHVHAGAKRILMCDLFACTSDNPLS